MYNKINITENHLRILSLFSKGFNKEYHIREVGKIANLSPRSAQLMLSNLEGKGILQSKTRGKIKAYSLRNAGITKEYLVLVEQYKLLSFLESHSIIREIIAKIRQHINGVGIVFGSYAKGIESKSSDLDIFIVGNGDKTQIKNISKTYGFEINVKQYPLNIFKSDLREDILIKEVLENHIIFLNSEQLIREAINYG